MQAAFTRVHQDFTANVLRGGKPNIVKNVREEIERDITLEEFKYWTALVGLAPYSHSTPVVLSGDSFLRKASQMSHNSLECS